MKKSVRLRENINQTIQQTGLNLETQWTATDYAFRKRIHEMEQTKHELEWQQRNVSICMSTLTCYSPTIANKFPQTEKEISEVEAEISSLKMSLALKTPPMMVVQTRLENRTQRPNIELCRDQPQYHMVEEVAKIADSQQALKEKLDVAE